MRVIDPLLVVSTCLLPKPNPQEVDTVGFEHGNERPKREHMKCHSCLEMTGSYREITAQCFVLRSA